MTLTRLTAWTLLLAAGFTLLPGRTGAQDALPSRPSVELIDKLREERGIPQGQLPQARESFAALAKYSAEMIAHPLIYKASQDPTKVPAGTPTADGVITGLNRFFPEPTPTSRVTTDQADYIREIGAAFDAALKGVVDGHPDRIVRINAARLYAHVCRTGAAAHWPTVTGWLTNPNTPTEIRHVALQAAANLLAAYDPLEYKGRRHAAPAPVTGALVAAVERCVLDPSAVMALPEGKVEKATPDQKDVVGFVRRQAVKTLAQVRFVTLPGPDGKTPLYPAHTLARVCLSDPALVPAPGPAECAEAVIGLCNMAPVVGEKQTPLKGFQPDAVAEAVAAGLITFAGPRATPDERALRLLPWRVYALRLGDAFRYWQPLFDTTGLFDPTKPATAADAAKAAPPVVKDLVARAQTALLAPMEKVGSDGKPVPGATVNVEAVRDFLNQLRANPKRAGMLIANEPATALPTAAPKK